ncbi:serine/threonine-protein kinase [Duganella sp. 1411]|uniref:serine/threonine-protein kinase n=1 Tax=Duganella sp. 1411 TaxID=2806572 RepID=UPI001AE9FF7C|nr:serine/threonine-protein kinase [Duganella sp. 1411]MBP1203954.1 serine/threonine-protein kinase [Duganella sp. 1411]
METPAPVSSDVTTSQISWKHYHIGKCLGEGGFGQVHEAWDSKLCRPVAIKRLKHAAVDHADLAREARMAASLRHPAFVKIHALEDDGQTQSIVMELVPGVTLKEWARARAPTEQDALRVVAQIAEAMHEAHASGLIHGDLKPSNLIVEPSGKVRILDFGLAIKHDDQLTASLAQADPQGTIAYMAPERLLGAAPSAASDIYALGMILYELCNGARPHAHLTGLSLAAAITQSNSEQWSYAPTLSPAAVRLMRAMTATPAERRIGSMQEALEQLAAASAGAVAATPPPTSGPRAHPRRRLIGLALVVLLLALAGLWRFGPDPLQVRQALTPYSESQEIKNGLAALKFFDRPGNLDRAGGNFSTVLKHNADSAAAVAGMAIVYRFRYLSDAEDPLWLQKADAGVQQAMRLNDQLALSQAARALVLDAQGKSEAALAAAERALSLDPLDFFGWHAKLTALRHLRRYDEARTAAEQAIGRFPQERVFADHLGTVHFEQGNYADAERAFRSSLQIQPDAVYAYANLFGALMAQNRGDDALQVLQQGLQIRPSARLFNNLGNAFFLRGDYVSAAAAFENAVSPQKGNPADYLMWANLADTLLWIPGREQQAREAYERAMQLLAPRLERSPGNAVLVSRMGLYSARVGDKAGAEALLRRAVEAAPKGPDIRFRAGLGYELIGNRDAALTEIAKARELGYPLKFIEAEPDLIALRRDSRYPGGKP